MQPAKFDTALHNLKNRMKTVAKADLIALIPEVSLIKPMLESETLQKFQFKTQPILSKNRQCIEHRNFLFNSDDIQKSVKAYSNFRQIL